MRILASGFPFETAAAVQLESVISKAGAYAVVARGWVCSEEVDGKSEGESEGDGEGEGAGDDLKVAVKIYRRRSALSGGDDEKWSRAHDEMCVVLSAQRWMADRRDRRDDATTVGALLDSLQLRPTGALPSIFAWGLAGDGLPAIVMEDGTAH